MSEHDRNDQEPDERDERHAPETHSLAQELREAVEKVEDVVDEVVEHVPEPVRWTVGKIVALVALGFVGLVVLAAVTSVLYVANRTEWAAQELSVLLNQMLVSRSDVSLAIKDIKGNPFTGVRVYEPSVRFRDGRGVTLLEAPTMTLRYSAVDLVMGKRSTIEVDLDRPIVRLGRGEDGKWRLPTWKSGSRRGARGVASTWSSAFTTGTVRLPDPIEPVAGLDLDASAQTGTTTRVAIHSLSWRFRSLRCAAPATACGCDRRRFGSRAVERAPDRAAGAAWHGTLEEGRNPSSRGGDGRSGALEMAGGRVRQPFTRMSTARGMVW
jgi:hypothetical protein